MDDLDEWWKTQQRSPCAYQVWTQADGYLNPSVCVGSTNDEKLAAQMCRDTPGHLTAWVLPPTPGPYLLRISAQGEDERTRGKRGPWDVKPVPAGWMKLLVDAERLSRSPGARPSDIGITDHRAQRIAAMLRAGLLEWRKRSKKVKRLDVHIVRDDDSVYRVRINP